MHLRVPRLTDWGNPSSHSLARNGFGLTSREIASCRLQPPPPPLWVADWRPLRSRHVRLLCCGLGDRVCLRAGVEEEEETEETGEGERGGERSVSCTLTHKRCPRLPPAHVVLRAFLLLTLPSNIVLSRPLGPQGSNSGTEPGRGETWLWPTGRRLGARPPSRGSPPLRHFWGCGLSHPRREVGVCAGRRPPRFPAAPVRGSPAI